MTVAKPPANLGTRGRTLWREVLAEREVDAAGRVLLHEACRIADRLEQLDRLLRGDVTTWTQITDDYSGQKRTTNVVLDDALGEARQQALAYRQLTTTLKLGTAAERTDGKAASALDQLAAARANRRAASSH